MPIIKSNQKSKINTTYLIHGKPVTQTKNSKYLGVVKNEKLSWNHNIDETIKKSNKALGFIKIHFYKSNKNIKLKCYLTLMSGFEST